MRRAGVSVRSGNRTAPVVVVTRPAPAGAKLQARLTEDGWQAIHCPAFELIPAADPEAAAESLCAALPADVVIFTSPAAARYALALAEPGAFRATTVVTPGAGTARELARAGIPEARYPETGGTSEDVLRLPELIGVDGMQVLIVAAPDGRGLLAEALTKRGARVERVCVYRRRPLAPSPEFLAALDSERELITLLSSTAAARVLADALEGTRRRRWLGGCFVVSSGRLARILRDLGADAGHIRVAAGAGDGAIHQALSRLGPDIHD